MDQMLIEQTDVDSPIGETFVIQNEDISFETVAKFVEVHNRYMKGEINFIHMYISSDGGDLHSMEVLIDMINDMGTSIGITAFGHIGSAAFELFFRAECPCRMLPGTLGMMHQSGMHLFTNESGSNPNAMDKAYHKYKLKYARESTQALNNFLKFTPKEMSDIKKGDDVWFSFERMLDMLSIKEQWLYGNLQEKPQTFYVSTEMGES